MQDHNESPSSGRPSRSFVRRHALVPADFGVLLAVVALTAVYTPFLFVWFWAPRMLIMYVAVLPGLVALAALARTGSRAAAAGLGLIAWSSLVALWSDSWAGSFFGFVGQEVSTVSVAGSLGMWALVQRMSKTGRRWFLPTVLGALLVNAVVGSLQMLVPITETALSLQGGRSTGLTANSVYLGAMMAAAGVLCIVFSRSLTGERLVATIIGAGVFGLVVAFSGSRAALGCIVIGVAYAAVHRSRRSFSAVVSLVVGVVIGGVIALSAPEGTGISNRLSESGGFSIRWFWWRQGWSALLERPFRGWGYGRFRTATQWQLSPDDVAAGRFNELQGDFHNVVVSFAVAVGIPGLVLAALFVVLTVRQSRGAVALAALAAALTWLLQPVSLTTLPLVMMLLGYAATSPRPDEHDAQPDTPPQSNLEWNEAAVAVENRRGQAVWAGSVIAGLGLAGWLGVAGYRMNNAVVTADPRAAESAAGMYFSDPIASNAAAEEWAFSLAFDRTEAPRMFAQLERTVELEPTRPLWHNELARQRGLARDYEAATAGARRALELQSTYLPAWQLLADVARRTDDMSLLEEANEQLCELGEADACDGG